MTFREVSQCHVPNDVLHVVSDLKKDLRIHTLRT